MRARSSLVFLLLGLAAGADAQGTADDYERARTLPQQWARLDRPFRPDWHWLEDGARLAFRDERGGEPVWVCIDRDGVVRRASEAKALGIDDSPRRLPPQDARRRSGRSTRASMITFDNRFDRPVRLFWIDGDGGSKAYGEVAAGSQRSLSTFEGHAWLVDFAADELAGCFVAGGTAGLAVIDALSQQAVARRPMASPRGRGLQVRDHDVWLRVGDEGGDGDFVRLSTSGHADDAFQLPAHWSPDGSKVLGFQVAPGDLPEVHLIESSPKDQLQPKLHTLPYRKPGDRIDRPRPRLFDVANRRQILVDDAPFADAWSIDHVTWAADGSEVRLLFNQRGHQRLRLLAIDAATGAVRTILEERSDTFIDWSQKTELRWLDGGRRFLWTSERDGWNHLYLGDASTGALVQLTKGRWLVRAIDRVDEAAPCVWLRVMGIHPDQDPYHVHFARVGFDGTLTVLTDGDGTHECTWAPDRRSFVDRWSRVDQPWVTEWRTADGAKIAEIARDDAAALQAAGFRPPLRFTAAGRDGKTPIFGILTLPSTFDPQRRYPVIEDIYAGPQGYFVPKAWGLGRRQRELAELGFVVVQIDGMGTNWRHKAFHDVCWRNLKDAGLPDRIVWLHEAQRTHAWLDLEHVGIFGGSAGGQNALAALLHHGDFYRAGAADCGCHDNRMDKIWWNEAWMGWPIGPWYADSSNVTHARKLRGDLLLTVGELDRNVDPSSTMQVVRALIDADKDFEFVIVPGGGHGVGESAYLVRRRQDFFVRHLLGKEPRRP